MGHLTDYSGKCAHIILCGLYVFRDLMSNCRNNENTVISTNQKPYLIFLKKQKSRL